MKKLMLFLALLLFGYCFTSQGAISKINSLFIYENPDLNSKTLRNVQANKHLIPILVQQDWIKVGDPSDGLVGWINKNQYRQAIQTLYQPNVQTLYIQTEEKNGQKQPKITAYRNGKPLSEKEAQELYNKIQQEQKTRSEHFRKMFLNMDHMIEQNLHTLQNSWIPLDIFDHWPYGTQPMIIISSPKENEQTKTKDIPAVTNNKTNASK